LWHVKNPFEVWTKILHKAKFIISFIEFLLLYYQMTLLVGLPESSGAQIRNPPLLISFHHGSPCSYITLGMNSRPIDGQSSERYSHHIDMIVINLVFRSCYQSRFSDFLVSVLYSKPSSECFPYSVLIPSHSVIC
jgi:hypothetical protein